MVRYNVSQGPVCDLDDLLSSLGGPREVQERRLSQDNSLRDLGLCKGKLMSGSSASVRCLLKALHYAHIGSSLYLINRHVDPVVMAGRRRLRGA